MNIKVKQKDITDCGAACIASVSAHYKLGLSIAKIRQLAGTNRKGTSISGIVEAAQKLNFDAKGVKGPFESLFKIPKPAIAHVIIENRLHHFVVIHKVTKNYIEVMDPIHGLLEKQSHEDFKSKWSGVLILIVPNDNFYSGNEKISIHKRFFNLIYPHTSVLIQVLVGAVFYTLLGLSSSIYVQKIVDHVLVESNRSLLNIMSVAMILLLLLQVVVGTVKSIFSIKIGLLIDSQLILGYYKHLLKLPQAFFDSMRVGELISRINDAVKIRSFLNDISVNLAVNFCIVLFSFGLMFTYYWKLAVILLISIPIYLTIYFLANQINKKVQRKLMEKSADLETKLVESLQIIGTVKRFGIENFSFERIESSFTNLLSVVFRSNVSSVYFGVSTEAVSRLLSIILLWVGSYYVLENLITPGELLSFYTLIGYFIGPVSSLINMNKPIQDAIIAADRLFEIFDLEQEESKKIELDGFGEGDIKFVNVVFKYAGRATVLNELNLTIRKGVMTSIVGESGSGKSTIASLLQCIYEANSGDIFLGAHIIKYISNRSLRKLISVVPQNIELIAGSVTDNIALGEYDVNFEKIVEITSQLDMIHFIEQLPNGFDTYIGENGASLSGGQKQKIAIARALYKDPEILIFDEATSSLDSISEKAIQKVIESLTGNGKTVIVIAHRLSTILKSDKIIVIGEGKVLEEGSHEQLISNKDAYFNLWNAQVKSHEAYI